MTDLPIADRDAEEAVIGALLLSPKAIEKCVDILDGNEFYLHSLAAMYRACVSLWERNQPVDGVSLVNELDRTGQLEAANGADNVHVISGMAAAASNVAHYAGIVRAKWLERELSQAGQAIASLATGSGSVADKIGEADRRILDLSNKLENRRESVYTSKDVVADFRGRIGHTDETPGVETPFPTFLKPLKPGRLYVLGGYQGDGKSVMALQFLRAACESGVRVGFASIEMSHQDLADRLVAMVSGVPHWRILEGDIAGFELEIEAALETISGWDFEIIDDEELDPTSIRRAQRRGRYGLLIVDHLHRMRVDRKHTRESVTENVRGMVNIARKYDVPVLLLAQLSRGQKHDPFPRPTMADFRETSAIESEAAMALFIWRIRKENVRTNEAELVVGKNRYGAEGYLNLRFKPSRVQFDPVR